METILKNRDIISITDFTGAEILDLCKEAKQMHELEISSKRYKLRNTLNHKALAYAFYEPSTRTRMSFNTAMRELGGNSDGFAGTEGTSIMKKETIRDTIVMIEANHFDTIVMRHPIDGSVQWAADVSQVPVINGGDGKNEHPTQALLDVFTLYMYNDRRLGGLNIGFGGDLSHGRTIRSLSLALSHFENITIRWAAEDFLGMPDDLASLLKARGVEVIRKDDVREVMSKSDFYYMTRPQTERMKDELKLSDSEIEDRIIGMMQKYKIDLKKVEGFDFKLLHPLPINSEIAEIDYQVYFSPVQGFFKQAEFGVMMRKAILYEMLKDGDYIQFSGNLSHELKSGNNRLARHSQNRIKEGKKFIDNISNGMVLDHLEYGIGQKVADALELIKRGLVYVTAALPKEHKSFLKTDLAELTERELKSIAMISPEPTANYIKEGIVADKFIYLLCKNDNCITRVVNEDVPPKFYNDDGKIRCRYCRRPYDFTSKKVSEEEKKDFLEKLPKGISPV
jgi:aspartate carbamoyltransferase catalytic subunit